MEIKDKGITIELTREEFIVIKQLCFLVATNRISLSGTGFGYNKQRVIDDASTKMSEFI